MSDDLSPELRDFLDSVPDPRMAGGNLLYSIEEVLFLSISASLCGFDAWTEIELFGNEQLNWLRKFFPYSNGIPSHDCLGKVFAAIDQDAFAEAFTRWATSLCSLATADVVALDGKCVRGSHDRSSAKAAIYLVSAFACRQGLTLAQRKVDDKSNEITAIPQLLDALVIEGCIITIDAAGCQRGIVAQIIDQKADYVIAVKDNQPKLFEQAQQAFANTKISDSCQSNDVGHGRVEKRMCQVVTNFRWLSEVERWQGLQAIARIDSVRFDKQTGVEQTESRFYICSITSASQILGAVRSHWYIENKLHWTLDVTFGEDGSRRRKDQSPANFGLVSKTALNLIKSNDEKGSIKAKRMKAVMNTTFREKLLFA